MPATPNLPTPDFTFDPDAPGACIAGLRPYRNGSYRLDHDTIGSKFIVHNYGHGGAGITLSWGCAAKVRDLVKQRVASSHDTTAAVLGAGVMGLTAATRLAELGLAVTIYAERMPAETTSAKAGGQWAVSVVEYQGKKQELTDIIKIAYTTFKASIGQGFGVYARPNYTAKPSENLDIVIKLAPGLIPPRVRLARLPFEGHSKPGYVYQTLLIEPPVFLKRLQDDLATNGVPPIQQRTFTSKSDVLGLTQTIIVNCTGLGAKTLWSDPAMVGIKGQLAMLRPQSQLQYLYGQHGYMFPRSDHVVIGGTFDVADDEIPNKATCQGLVDVIAAQFGQAPAVALPANHIHHPDHAAIVNPAMVRARRRRAREPV